MWIPTFNYLSIRKNLNVNILNVLQNLIAKGIVKGMRIMYIEYFINAY